MVGRFDGWTLLVVLAAGAAFAAEPIFISRMEWTAMEDPNTPILTVCADDDFMSQNITLVVGLSGTGARDYPAVDVDTNCANFTDAAAAPPSDGPLAYQLNVVDSTTAEYLQTGFVTFTLSMTSLTVECESNYALISIVGGKFDNESCLPGLEPESLECYVPADDPRVCVLELDLENSPDLQVCVTQTPVDSTGAPGVLNVRALVYPNSNVEIETNQDAGIVLSHLISSNLGTGIASVSSCDQDSCPLYSFSPSAELYNWCGVYTNAANDSITTATGTFQDLDLKVELADPILNFYFVNQFSEGMYKVYTSLELGTFNPDEFTTLDCTRVSPGAFCYGFVAADSTVEFVAVSYDNKANAVISSTN